MTGRRWEIRIPAPIRILSFNQDQGRGARAHRKVWRDEAHRLIGDARVPVGLDRIRIDINIRFPAAGRRDISNYHPTIAKPIVDAIGPQRVYVREGVTTIARGHGIIRDDTPQFLCCTDCPHITFGEPVGRDDPRWPYGLVVLTITDMSAVTV